MNVDPIGVVNSDETAPILPPLPASPTSEECADAAQSPGSDVAAKTAHSDPELKEPLHDRTHSAKAISTTTDKQVIPTPGKRRRELDAKAQAAAETRRVIRKSTELISDINAWEICHRAALIKCQTDREASIDGFKAWSHVVQRL